MNRYLCALAAAAVGVLALTAAGCGGSDNNEPSKIAVTASDTGRGSTYTLQAPSKADGGLVEVTLTNNGKVNHSAQLIKVEGNHTIDQALQATSGNQSKVPDWVRGEGGVEEVPPGQTASATVNIDSGNYFFIDDAQNNGARGKPATAPIAISGGSSGDLPSTDASVTAAPAGEDHWQWQVTGLKAGANQITFNSKGDNTLHHIVATPIKDGATIDQVRQELESQSNGPPKTVDITRSTHTAVLDSGKSEVTTLNLQPGRYAFICFLSDRDGGKPHFAEGLLKEVTIPQS